MARRLAAIMYTDVAGFTASAQADEAGTLALLREQEGIVRPLFPPFGGREVKSTGDGFLVEFDSALKATECAVEIQRRLRERNSREPSAPIHLRIGVHVGDVEESGGDIFGDAVNFASRVVPVAAPDGICLSSQVFDQVQNKIPYRLERLPARSLKGIRGTPELYSIVLPWEALPAASAENWLPRLAILPLANISRDPDNEYFADGLTEELITVISQIKGLRVISRTSVNQYKGTTKPLSEIGAELGVDSVLEGSVRKVGDQLRIAVQLIDTKTDEHRWAQTYDRKLENVFAIQAEVAERTAGALKVELLKSERDAIEERPTASLAAYESYLHGIEAFRRFPVPAAEAVELDRAAERYFEAAIRVDPGFAAAYAYFANHLIGILGNTRPAKAVLPRIRELVAKALELNPHSPDTHLALGNLAMQGDLDWPRAEAEFQQAIALNPSSSAARFWYAYLLWVMQRLNEAKKQYLAAAELDPLWFLPRQHLAILPGNSGDYASQVEAFQTLAKSFPDNPQVRNDLAWSYAAAGRSEEALRLVEPLASATNLDGRVIRANVLAMLGHPEEMRSLSADWEAGRLPVYVGKVNGATAFALLGDREKALDLLEQDFREGDRTFWVVYQSPYLDGIRDDPRFVALLRASNLPTTLPRPRWRPATPA